jgi:hydroxymethylglutaryl-CoA synthase
MVGIKSLGAYIPLQRMSYEELGKAWGIGMGKGERSVSSSDEDSLTMAVEAAVDCLNKSDRSIVDGVIFASASSPFYEKQVAATIGVAADLNRNISTMDVAGSLRGGTGALKAAFDAVAAGSNKNVVVSAADCRMGYPGSSLESTLGDGAAALLIGDTDVAANITGMFSVSDEITDYWRRSEDRFVNAWEDRFVMTKGYQRVMLEAVKGAFDKFGVDAGKITKFVANAPAERSYWQVAGQLGFDLQTQVQMPVFSTVGNTGTASGLMHLVACLEEASAGDLILFANYGNGCDVFMLEVTDNISGASGAKGMAGFLASKKMIANYNQYLSMRSLLPESEDRLPPIRPPATITWRDQKSLLRFTAMKCNNCGHGQYPIHRICSNCSNKDDYSEYRLSDRIAEVFSCTVDNLGYGGGLAPFWAIADFDDVRTRLQIADAELAEVSIGDSLEMTFRKFPSANDVPVYGWKGRPIR